MNSGGSSTPDVISQSIDRAKSVFRFTMSIPDPNNQQKATGGQTR